MENEVKYTQLRYKFCNNACPDCYDILKNLNLVRCGVDMEVRNIGEPCPYFKERKDDMHEATTHDVKKIANDPVNHPSHYTQGDIECIDAIKAATGKLFEGYLQGQIIKYVWRYQHKGKCQEDLEKARWYLNRLIEEYESQKN